MITLTKEAVQTVLDALEGVTAYTALLDDFTMAAAKESAEVLQAAIDAPEQEPVSWQVSRDGEWEWCKHSEVKFYKSCGKPVRPLYTAPPAPQARELSAVREAIEDYYLSLDRREHGGVAQDRAFNKIEQALGMGWVRGAVLAVRSKP